MKRSKNTLDSNMSIGSRIKQRRKVLGFTVDDVAKGLGKNRATIYRYESGYIKDIPSSLVVQIAHLLSTSPSYLMGWEDQSKEVETK